MNCGALSPGASFVIGTLVAGRSPVGAATDSVAAAVSRPYGSDVGASEPGTEVVCVTVRGDELAAVVWLP